MNLTIRHFIFGIVLGATPMLAQENVPKTDSITYKKTVSFNLSLIQPIAIGDNFMANGTDINLGGRFDVRAHFLKKISLRLRLEGFGYDVTDPSATGLYDRGSVLSISIAGGYQFFEGTDFGISASAGVGSANYGNIQGGERFGEAATIFWAGAEATFALNRYIHIFGGIEIRSDQLNINTPPQIQLQFNSVQYIVLHAGIRIQLWNKEGDE
jgi:hypothetical protein